MYFISNHKWKILIVLIVVLVVCITFLLLFLKHNSEQKKKYKSAIQKNWNMISDKADAFIIELDSTKSVYDFKNLKDIAVDLNNTVRTVYETAKKYQVPSSMEDLHKKELASLESMEKYLDLLIELSDEAKVYEFEDKSVLLKDRGRKASAAMNEFRELAEFLDMKMSSDLFNGAGRLSAAINYRGENYEEEASRVYDTLKTFMDADIKEVNGDILWALAATPRRQQLVLLGGDQSKMVDYRNVKWKDKNPESYYISKSSISFPSPGVAEAKIIVFLGGKTPLKSKAKLVLEPDGWKVLTYPFLGWVE